MTLVPLGGPGPETLARALRERGLDAGRADATVRGLRPFAVVLEPLDAAARDRVVAAAARSGVECLTGEGWACLSGSAARLAGLARPDTSLLPPALAERLGRLVADGLDRPDAWVTARGRVPLGRPVVAGILNVTPDSFSDGGRYLDPEAALRHAEHLLEAGADMLDVGAESTRPGRPEPVAPDEEWRRLQPVLAGLARRHPAVPVSVDTVKAETARRALGEGAWAVNDVSGLRHDPAIADICAAAGAGLVLMHSRGTVADMASYDHATYADPTAEVLAELRSSVEAAETRGVQRERLVVDPGLGFAKTPDQTLRLLGDLPAVAALGHPVMVGPSRKRFLGAVTGRDLDARDAATAAACVVAFGLGAAIFRVHAPGPVREALAVAHAIRSA